MTNPEQHIENLNVAKAIIANVIEEAFDNECHECSACGFNRPTYPDQSRTAHMGNGIINRIEKIIVNMRNPDFYKPREG